MCVGVFWRQDRLTLPPEKKIGIKTKTNILPPLPLAVHRHVTQQVPHHPTHT